MSGILQGTTPQLIITVPADVPLADVTAVELVLAHKGSHTVLTASDVVIDTEANSITYTFPQEYTLTLDATHNLKWQLRLAIGGTVYGTQAQSIDVYDLINKAVLR